MTEYSSLRGYFSTELLTFQPNTEFFSTENECFFSERTLGKISLKHELYRKIRQARKKIEYLFFGTPFRRVAKPTVKVAGVVKSNPKISLGSIAVVVVIVGIIEIVGYTTFNSVLYEFQATSMISLPVGTVLSYILGQKLSKWFPHTAVLQNDPK